jgi:hypothetical protein
MKFLSPLFAVVFAGLALLPAAPATASEAAIWRYDRHGQEPAFPLSKRAQSVWASGACWSECGSYTAWNLAACLEQDRQGYCLKRADAADRACQRRCRTRGGPLLPIDF